MRPAICLAILLLLVLIYIRTNSTETFLASVPSAEPIPYGRRRSCPSGAICIRRWRTPVPAGPNARSVADDVWARTYDSGIGFQLA